MESKVMITTDTGEVVTAQAPVIVSASRATDIPAFYADWMFGEILILLNRCIDPDLMLRLSPNDHVLANYLYHQKKDKGRDLSVDAP